MRSLRAPRRPCGRLSVHTSPMAAYSRSWRRITGSGTATRIVIDRGVRYATKRDREFGLYWGLKPTIESVVVWGEKPYAPEPLSCRPFYPRARRHRSTRIERSTPVGKDPFVGGCRISRGAVRAV